MGFHQQCLTVLVSKESVQRCGERGWKAQDWILLLNVPRGGRGSG